MDMRPLAVSIAASVTLHVAATVWLKTSAPPSDHPRRADAPLQAALVVQHTASQPSKPPRERHGVNVLPFAPSIYYAASQVDVKATPVDMKTAVRTPDNFPLGRIVTVKLRLFINEEGAVDAYDILDANGLAQGAQLQDIREIRFRPAERSGQPVKSKKVVEISFVP